MGASEYRLNVPLECRPNRLIGTSAGGGGADSSSARADAATLCRLSLAVWIRLAFDGFDCDVISLYACVWGLLLLVCLLPKFPDVCLSLRGYRYVCSLCVHTRLFARGARRISR